MYRFAWDALVTDELAAHLGRIGGLPEGNWSDGLRQLTAKILAAVGGLPLCEGPLDPATRTAMATRYLLEATQRLLMGSLPSRPGSGFARKPADNKTLGELIVAVPPTEINWATRQQLAVLPGIGQEIADRIVQVRTESGYFDSLEELVSRVPGLGPSRGEAIRNAVSFSVPSARRLANGLSAELDEALTQVLEACAPGPPEERLAAALDLVASNCSRHTHPATRYLVIRRAPASKLEERDTNWVGLLDGPEYYEAVPPLIGEAASSIAVCMFHVAFPNEGHPTRRLLDALVAAQARGVGVRVLLDTDREEDPYRSTVINTSARQYLERQGVACRFDQPGRLLHSKYLLIDTSLVVLGSHNWSAGSYFESDDVSLVIQSQALVQELIRRFDTLWAQAG